MPLKTVAGVRFFAFDSFASHLDVTSIATTRHSGVSPAPYDSLNLGLSTGDDADNVAANRARLTPLTTTGPGAIVGCGQVHSNTVAVVTRADGGKRRDATDALVTGTPDLPVMILVADCAPVSLYDPIKRVIGLAHAGWRGTAAGIATRTLQCMMDEFGTDPTDVVAGVGPSIGPCCYEVGTDVADAMRAGQPLTADHALRPAGDGHFMLDLWRANTLQLVTAGVFEANVETANLCTACNPAEFFSHRASGGRTGRSGALMILHEKTKRSY